MFIAIVTVLQPQHKLTTALRHKITTTLQKKNTKKRKKYVFWDLLEVIPICKK